MSSGFRDHLQDSHDRQRAARDEQHAEQREAARALQRAKQEERLRERHKEWQLALEARIGALHDRLHGQAPARGAARELLIAEAADRFQARGFADVSMQEIADAVGVTKAAMYYHFQSKEALFEVVVERSIHAFWEGISVHARADGPLRDVLRDIVAYVKLSLESVSPRLLDDFTRHCSADAQQRIFFEHPTPERELCNLFDRAIAVGEMRPLDSEAVAEMFLAMLMSLGRHSHTHRQPQPGDDELLLDVILHGIAPAAPATSA